jgi:hypothetical protein
MKRNWQKHVDKLPEDRKKISVPCNEVEQTLEEVAEAWSQP